MALWAASAGKRRKTRVTAPLAILLIIRDILIFAHTDRQRITVPAPEQREQVAARLCMAFS